MNEKKFNPQLEYERDDFTPGFVFAVILTILVMLAVIILFGLILSTGTIAISEAINGWFE